MIEKPLIILSILFSSLGFHNISARYDQAISKLDAGNTNSVVASVDANSLGFPDILPTPKVKIFSEKPNILAKYFLIGDLDSSKILYQEGASTEVPIASTTKIMTAIIALENYDLKDIVTVPASATSQNPQIIPTVVNLRAGERITVSELLNCLLIQSGNDSAFAIASHLSPDDDIMPFVDLMNKKAAELGMNHTLYKDPAGLDDSGYSTVDDLFIATKYAMKFDTFREIVATKEYVAQSIDDKYSHQLSNSNRLVNGYDYIGAIGVKTGFTTDAGHCLVSAVEREGHTLIGVVLNTYSQSATASADESRKLQDWAWNNVEWK